MANSQKCNFGHSLVPWMTSLDYWTISVTWWSIEYWLPFYEGMITSRDWNSTTNRSWNPNSFKADCSDMANCQKCNFGHSLVSSMPSLDYSTISAPWWSIEYWLLFHEGMITSRDWNLTTTEMKSKFIQSRLFWYGRLSKVQLWSFPGALNAQFRLLNNQRPLVVNWIMITVSWRYDHISWLKFDHQQELKAEFI